MKEPVTHIERPSLPWRPDQRLTECRLDANSYPTWTREQAIAKAKELGRTRFYMVGCVTCIQTCDRYQTWETNPASAMAREVERHNTKYGAGPDPQIVLELRAIAILIEAHREEFDELLSGLDQTVSLSDRRARNKNR